MALIAACLNQAWELSMKTQISMAVKLTPQREKLSTVRRNQGPKKGSTGFSSAPKTRATYRTCSRVAIARLSRLIVNTAAGCYSQGQALGLNAVIPTCFCAMRVF